MTDDYERDENGNVILSIDNLERAQREIENKSVGISDTITPVFECPNPNNLEPHYFWFSCLLRCVVNKTPKTTPPKGKVVKYRGMDILAIDNYVRSWNKRSWNKRSWNKRSWMHKEIHYLLGFMYEHLKDNIASTKQQYIDFNCKFCEGDS